MTFEIAVYCALVVLLLAGSGFFSGSETAFFALNHLEKAESVQLEYLVDRQPVLLCSQFMRYVMRQVRAGDNKNPLAERRDCRSDVLAQLYRAPTAPKPEAYRHDGEVTL